MVLSMVIDIVLGGLGYWTLRLVTLGTYPSSESEPNILLCVLVGLVDIFAAGVVAGWIFK